MDPIRFTLSLGLALLAVLGSSHAQDTASDAAIVQGGVMDIDGNSYPIVRVGRQVWLARNLEVSREPAGGPVKSYFFDDDSTKYAGRGRLYTWDVAMSGSSEPGAQGICPDGWHLPTDEDWIQLFEHVGGAGAELLAGGSTGFEASLDGGADYHGNYLYRGEFALFWSSTAVNDERAYHHSISRDGELDKFAAVKGARIYIRCVGN